MGEGRRAIAMLVVAAIWAACVAAWWLGSRLYRLAWRRGWDACRRGWPRDGGRDDGDDATDWIVSYRYPTDDQTGTYFTDYGGD